MYRTFVLIFYLRSNFMVNYIATKIGKKVAKKAGGKALKKTFDTLEYIDERIGWGVKPLNIGEKETVECYKQYPKDPKRCQALGNKKRDEYHHPWRSKK